MFKMRREQKEAFSRDAMADFEARTMAHLAKHFPAICQTVGDRIVLRLVRHAVERAASYGIDTERGAATYAHVVLMYGRDFDVDPTCAWAAEILDPRAPIDPAERADLLLDAAFAHQGDAGEAPA
jgi:hypothetical protein